MEGVVEEDAAVVVVEVQEVEGGGEVGGLAEEGQVGVVEVGLVMVGMVEVDLVVVGMVEEGKAAQGEAGEEV